MPLPARAKATAYLYKCCTLLFLNAITARKNRGAEHEHLEAVMAFYERRSSRKIIRYWRARRARIRKAEAEAQRRARAAAKEKARQESALHVSVDDDDDDRNSDAAPVSPIRTQMDEEEEEEVSDEQGQASPSDARVGANLRWLVLGCMEVSPVSTLPLLVSGAAKGNFIRTLL